MTPEQDFEFPEIHVGDRVEVSNDPSEGDKTVGLIRKVKTGSADILAFARYDFGDRLIVVLNRSGRTEEVKLPVPPGFPMSGRYRELVGGRRYRAGKERLPVTLPPQSVSIFCPGQ